jgi:hypothetical protein
MIVSDYIPNQLDLRLLGVNGMNFADGLDSSPRKQMLSSHLGQSLVVKGGTERFIQTGMERRYARTTFSVKMPVNGVILKVIPRYLQTGDIDNIKNPETILIYEAEGTGEIGMIRLPGYFSDQTYFGFEYRPGKITNKIGDGLPIKKGEILLDSPSVTENGDYKPGVECNVAYMSHPGVSEDGIVICRDVLPRFAFKTYERREAEWGSHFIPLNMYGDEFNYKPFPDIGDRIRADGILMALRQDDRSLAIVEQSTQALMEVDHHHDRRIYAAGAGGKVVDIKIFHDDYVNSNSPENMEKQAMRYHRASQRFYREVLNVIKPLEHQRGESLRLTPQLQQLAVEADALLDNRANGSQERRILLHRKNPLDHWRVEFVIEYDNIPDLGNKVTDLHGGKGVIVHIAEPEDMPVDEDGNRADLILDGNSTNSRMNLGRVYEQYINAASRDLRKRICKMLGMNENTPALKTKLEALEESNPQLIDEVWNMLMGYFQIVSPVKMYKPFMEGKYPHSRAHYLSSVLSLPNGIILRIRPDNEREFPDIVRMCQADLNYRPVHGQVTYRGYSGRKVTTKNKVRIGSVYIILLEKIADDGSAVSSGKLQHYGVLSQITSWDKYSSPYRNQPIRNWDESSIRIYASFAGSRATADIMDRNNNPKTRRFILDTILDAERPTNIERVVDRKQVPYGGNKPLQLIAHMAQCNGWEFHYQPFVSDYRIPLTVKASQVTTSV